MSQAVRTIGFACGVIAAIVGYFLLMSALLDAMIALGHGGLVRSYNATVMVIKGIPAAIFLVISYVLLKRFLHEHRSARVVALT